MVARLGPFDQRKQLLGTYKRRILFMHRLIYWLHSHRGLTTQMLVLALALLPGTSLTAATSSSARITQTGIQQSTESTDVGWPRLFALENEGTAVVYQPQVQSWDNQTHVVAWAAVTYEEKGAKKPTLGTIKIEADTSVALAERMVSLSPFKITEFNFPSMNRDTARIMIEGLRSKMSTEGHVIALDRVLAYIDKSTITPKVPNAAGLKYDPPKIFYSAKPAILVLFDGEPVWAPIKDSDLKYAVNTNWDVFQDTSKNIYLRNDQSWLTATKTNGPWTPATKLPTGLSSLPADDNWKDVKANVPGKPLAAGSVPVVFDSIDPAELILTQGQPAFSTVAATTLLWVSNTESDVFRDGQKGAFYYLVAGRWFSADTLQGPWKFATTSLPESFKKIPVDHPRSRVLASVPGTDQAVEGVLLASIPQTARVNAKDLKGPQVEYFGGQPEFKLIETTTIERAVNTDMDVLKVGERYYLCYQGVFFVSTSPTGPWDVAKVVPQDIYSIPASSPSYPVTYVKVEKDESEEDDMVTYASYAGYTGMMVGWGCAMWGTGWYYPPYWYGGYYPIWYPPTYGFAAWYNPYTGTFGRGVGVYGPYGGAGAWGAYNPRTGTYARGGSIYGPSGSRSFAQAFNPRTGTYAQTRQGSGVYGNWGSSYVQRGDNWAKTGHVTNDAKGRTTSGIKTSEGGGALHTSGSRGTTTIGKTGSGDVYAGHDGNVYRKTDEGGWQKWNEGSWNEVERPTKPGAKDRDNKMSGDAKPKSDVVDQLNRDKGARREGSDRARDSSTYRNRSSGGRSSAGSYRGGGMGGMRGGGGRR